MRGVYPPGLNLEHGLRILLAQPQQPAHLLCFSHDILRLLQAMLPLQSPPCMYVLQNSSDMPHLENCSRATDNDTPGLVAPRAFCMFSEQGMSELFCNTTYMNVEHSCIIRQIAYIWSCVWLSHDILRLLQAVLHLQSTPSNRAQYSCIIYHASYG